MIGELLTEAVIKPDRSLQAKSESDGSKRERQREREKSVFLELFGMMSVGNKCHTREEKRKE